MKFKASTYIFYRKRKLFKLFTISKVIGRTHAKKVLKDNLKQLYPGKRTEILTLNKID